jgi:hypothetical protein
VPRGGFRRGAGRKKGSGSLSEWQARLIGIRCEFLHLKFYRENRKEVNAFLEPLEELWSIARAVPVHERKAWTESIAFDDFKDDVDGVLSELNGEQVQTPHSWDSFSNYANLDLAMDDLQPKRLHSISLRRPKGEKGESFRASVIEQVSGVYGIAPGTVDKCWKKYRKSRKPHK